MATENEMKIAWRPVRWTAWGETITVLLGKDWEHDMNYAANNYTVIGNIYEIEKI